jgi:hypothetical protein
MCRSISLPTAWYLAIPLEEMVSHVKEYLPAHSLVPGYTPGGSNKHYAGVFLSAHSLVPGYTPEGGGKPYEGVSPCQQPHSRECWPPAAPWASGSLASPSRCWIA